MRRRDFMQLATALAAGGTPLGNAAAGMAQEQGSLTRETLIQAERMAGVSFTDAQREMILPVLQNYVQNMQSLREMSVPPDVAPAMIFVPDLNGVWTTKRGKRGRTP